MDSFLYLRDSGFDGDNQAVDSQDQEQQPVVYMDDQRQSWPNHDALNTIQDHHDVTHFLLPMENEEWSILHENQLLTDQTMFQDGKSTSMDMAPEANSVPAGPNSSVDNISDAHYVTPDMIYQGNTEAVSGREAPKPTEQSIPNESTRMSTRSRTKKVDAAPNEDGTKMQKESEETAERKRKGQKTKKLYCICQQPYDGNPMVQCDNCQEWFHCSCVNLDADEAEDMDWTCDSCPKVSKIPGKVKKKDHNNRWRKEREASAEWAGSDQEDEAIQEERKKTERKKSGTPAKCLLSTCSKLARNDSLFCSEKCATDHVNDKATTRRRSKLAQSPDAQTNRSSQEKETAPKKQANTNTQIKNTENDAVRRNVVKSLTATLKGLIETALLKDPTLFANDDNEISESNSPTAQSSNEMGATITDDTGNTKTAQSGTNINHEKSKTKTTSPSAMQIAEQLAANMENAMFEHLAEPHPKFPASKPQTCGEKYKGKFRSLLYNLKDKANEIFQLRVITGDLAPEILVNMSGEDMANPELKSMSETLRQKSIKNSVLKIQNLPIIKKTHKGDIIMLPPKESSSFTEDQVAKKSPLVRLDDQKSPGSSLSPSSRKSSISLTPKSPTIKTDTLDDILARMVSTNTEKENGKGKRAAEDTIDKEQKKRKMEIDMEKLLGDEDVQLEIGSDDEGLITSTIRSNDDDIHLSNTEEQQSATNFTPSSESRDQPKGYSQIPIWHGKTIMQQVAEFESLAYQIGGRPLAHEEWCDIFTPTIWIEGRIPTDRVTDYLTQTQFSSSKELIMIEVKCSEHSGQQEADNLLKYFHSRQRYGVVARNKTTIKDFYIIPLAAQDTLPDCLVALKHDLPDYGRERDMLLGIVVLNKKLTGDQHRSTDRHSRHGSSVSMHAEPVSQKSPEQSNAEETHEPVIRGTPNLSGILQGGELNPLLKQLLSNKDIVQLLNKNQASNVLQTVDGAYSSIPSPRPSQQVANAAPYQANHQQFPALPPNTPPSHSAQHTYPQYDQVPSAPAYQPYQQSWNNSNPAYSQPDASAHSKYPGRQTRWDTPGAGSNQQYPTGPASMYPPRDRGPPRGPEYNRGRGRGPYGQTGGRGRRGHHGDGSRPRRR
ncbi:Transcription factor bye1 [Umbelopsis nana]